MDSIIYLESAELNYMDKLPDNISFMGSLTLFNYLGTNLPNNLSVKKTLSIYYSWKINELPSDIKVLGTLDIQHSSIQVLPENLNTGGLNLKFTAIEDIPSTACIKYFITIHEDHNDINIPSGLKNITSYV